MIGNGTANPKIATKETAASPMAGRLRSALDPIRTTACSTIARTAALQPEEGALDQPDVTVST